MAMIFVYEHRISDFRCIGDKELPAGLEGRAFQHVRDGIAWTDSRVLSAYEALGDALGPVDVECCFLPPGKGNPPTMQGLALDMGRRLTEEKRKRLWAFCLKSPMFSYVEPPYWTPNWVHGEVAASAASIPRPGIPPIWPPGTRDPMCSSCKSFLTSEASLPALRSLPTGHPPGTHGLQSLSACLSTAMRMGSFGST